MKLIVKKPDGGVVIIYPNTKKYGPQREEIMKTVEKTVLKDVEHTIQQKVFIFTEFDKQGKPVGGKEEIREKTVVEKVPEKVTEQVVDRVIKPYNECKALQYWTNPDNKIEEKGPDGQKKLVPHFAGQVHEWFTTDASIDKSDIESRKQLYWEGNEVKKDYGWEKRLMPDQLIKGKHLKRLQSKIKTELAKTTPDAIAAMRLQNEHDECRDKKAGNQNDDAFWLDKAIANMDEDGHGKPDIRQKIADRLVELVK